MGSLDGLALSTPGCQGREPVKAVVACGLKHIGIVLATDSGTLAFDVAEIANRLEDIGLAEPPEPGVWLFSGTVRWESGGAPWDGQEPPSPTYDGDYRRPADLAELNAWLELVPPVEEEPPHHDTPGGY